MAFDPSVLRPQFPALQRTVGGKPLLYLDSAATAQVPVPVLAAMDAFDREHRGNVHRGMHVLAEEATDAYEGARERVRKFLNAAHADEIVFTKSCTEAINIVARGMDTLLQPGDAVALTLLEHHSNIVPWQQLQERRGIEIVWIDITDDGLIDDASLAQALLHPRLKLVAITALSNVLGVRPDVRALIDAAHARNALVLVDAAQLVGHDAIDVQALDCDFLTFSGHKLYGPTGIGVLYGKRNLLTALPALLGGGNMIEQVTMQGYTSADAPLKFEAGTPPLTQAIGLAAAIDWVSQWPLAERRAHEHSLLSHALTLLTSVPAVKILGPASAKQGEGVLSFVIDSVHPHDLTSVLSEEGICMRAGHHCTQPLHHRLGIEASTRLSVALYNTTQEMDRLPEAIDRAIKKLL